MNALAQQLCALIEREGPLTIAQFMTAALHDSAHGYYATRPRLGGEGDFITAPETSQMFGELIGLWAAQSWLEIGGPADSLLIELGPGRGVMMADIWRAAGALPGYRDAARVILCETSAVLIAAQKATLTPLDVNPSWIATLDEAPGGAAIIFGNEFLDCLPIRQFVRVRDGWREKLVGVRDGALVFGLAGENLANLDLIPASLRDAAEGAVAEIAPGLGAFVDKLAARFKGSPGRALLFDYGSPQTSGCDTLQALARHASADPLDAPGEADLTAHVDFAALKTLAEEAGLSVAGPVAQGQWLKTLGIETRAAALQKARPEKAGVIARQLARLTAPDQMGILFQAVCLSSAGLAPPAGFAPSESAAAAQENRP